jgi:hypothetical protein
MSSMSRRSFSGLVSLGIAGLASPALARAAGRPASQPDDLADIMMPRTPIIISGGSILINTRLDLGKPKNVPKDPKDAKGSYEYELPLVGAHNYRVDVMEFLHGDLVFHPDVADASLPRRLTLYDRNGQQGLDILSVALPPGKGSKPRTMTLKGEGLQHGGQGKGGWRQYRASKTFRSYHVTRGAESLKGERAREVLFFIREA